jgi:hypothetical protein
VRREFEWGPIATLIGSIELEPAGDAVKVKASAEFIPRNLLGRFLWRAASGSVDDMLAFCDDYLLRKGAGKIDPVPIPSGQSPVDKAQLDRLMKRLAKTPVRQDLLPPLRERIVEGSDDQVLGMRAYAVADTWGADRLEVLRLFLHATRIGLLELRWELMCPNCRVPKAEAESLAKLPGRFHCETCGISYTTDFDQRVELRFSVHQAIRKAVDNIYCIGGPLRMPHVFAQQYLAPHESRRLDVDLGEPLRLRAVGGTKHLSVVPDLRRSGQSEVRVTYSGGALDGAAQPGCIRC